MFLPTLRVNLMSSQGVEAILCTSNSSRPVPVGQNELVKLPSGLYVRKSRQAGGWVKPAEGSRVPRTNRWLSAHPGSVTRPRPMDGCGTRTDLICVHSDSGISRSGLGVIKRKKNKSKNGHGWNVFCLIGKTLLAVGKCPVMPRPCQY